MTEERTERTDIRVVGFFGFGNYDIMLLAARRLQEKGKRVLLLDYGTLGALSASVPAPEEMDAEEFIIEHNGLFFSRREIDAQMCRSYDVLLIDFGVFFKHRSAGLCTRLVYISDMLPHHMEPLLTAPLHAELVKDVVLRDVISFGGRTKELVKHLEKKFPEAAFTFLSADRKDVKNRYVCECEYEYELKHASWEMQEFIKGFTERLYERNGGA